MRNLKKIFLASQKIFIKNRPSHNFFTNLIEFVVQINYSIPLGKGTFGNVYEGKFYGDPVAVKQMTTTTSEKEFIQREMSKHIELNHVNVVKLWDVTDSADNIFTYVIAIIVSFSKFN